MKLKPLTTRQEKVLGYVEKYLEKHGFPPTLKEIGEAIGLTNITAVRGHLLALEKKGYITKMPEKARSIQVVHSPSAISRLKRKIHEVLRTNEGVLHQVVYGLAWTTWHRMPYLAGPVREWINDAIDREVVERGWSLLDRRVEKDHIVLVVKTWPNHSPEQTVRRLQAAGKMVKHHYPDAFPEKGLWGRGYVVATSFELLDDLVVQLLNDQTEGRTEGE
jgi:REP element-mobilizing transposase RayT